MLGKVIAMMAGIVLALALVPGVVSAADEKQGLSAPMTQARQTSAAAGQVLVRQTADLRPISASPAPAKWRIDRLQVEIDVLSSLFIDAYVTLGDYADSDEDALVKVQFGHRDGNNCRGIAAATKSEETDTYTRQHHLFGYTPSSWGPKPGEPWDCVIAVVTSPNGSTVHDILVGPLQNTYEAPRLAVGTIAVLGQKQKKLKISKGGWTPVEVTVANRGNRHAGRVTVTGTGRGLKVKKGSLDRVSEGGSSSAVVKVKKVGRKKPKSLVLTARAAGGVVAKRTIRVKQVKLPRKPSAGRYRGAGGDVRFQIRKGRVAGFSVTTLTRCGGYGTVPTYQQNTYNFPKRKIPRNGILTASARGKAYGTPWSTTLRMRVNGKKVTRGLFRYSGPGGCSTTESFTAKRAAR